MTREEAIKILSSESYIGNSKLDDAIEYAIEALSEPTKTDTKRGAIDKGKVLDILIKHQIEINFDAFDEMWEEVDALPFIKPTTITENMTNGDVIKAMFPDMRKKGTYCEFFFDDTKAIQTNSYMHVSEHWFNTPYKGNFTMPTRPKTKWIPVSEKLPEEYICDDGYIEPSDYVLVWGDHGNYGISRYWGNRRSKSESPNTYKDWMDLDWVAQKPIAWMPLPEPYSAEVESEE